MTAEASPPKIRSAIAIANVGAKPMPMPSIANDSRAISKRRLR
jgi:hypothetical protein